MHVFVSPHVEITIVNCNSSNAKQSSQRTLESNELQSIQPYLFWQLWFAFTVWHQSECLQNLIDCLKWCFTYIKLKQCCWQVLTNSLRSFSKHNMPTMLSDTQWLNLDKFADVIGFDGVRLFTTVIKQLKKHRLQVESIPQVEQSTLNKVYLENGECLTRERPHRQLWILLKEIIFC